MDNPEKPNYIASYIQMKRMQEYWNNRGETFVTYKAENYRRNPIRTAVLSTMAGVLAITIPIISIEAIQGNLSFNTAPVSRPLTNNTPWSCLASFNRIDLCFPIK
jgi:hypothetical protein